MEGGDGKTEMERSEKANVLLFIIKICVYYINLRYMPACIHIPCANMRCRRKTHYDVTFSVDERIVLQTFALFSGMCSRGLCKDPKQINYILSFSFHEKHFFMMLLSVAFFLLLFFSVLSFISLLSVAFRQIIKGLNTTKLRCRRR